MVVYRIRHKGTGLFYYPSRVGSHYRSNLTKDGKIYAKKPSIKRIDGCYYYPHGIKNIAKDSDFEIVPYELVELSLEHIGEKK